jgi:hypothetical protein
MSTCAIEGFLGRIGGFGDKIKLEKSPNPQIPAKSPRFQDITV